MRKENLWQVVVLGGVLVPVALGRSGSRVASDLEFVDQTGPVFGPPVPTRIIEDPTATPTLVPSVTPAPTDIPPVAGQFSGELPGGGTSPPNEISELFEPVEVKTGPDLVFAQDIFRETNLARRANGLKEVSLSLELTDSAQKYSELLAVRWEQKIGGVGHYEDGTTPQQRAEAEGYTGAVGENMNGLIPSPENNAKFWVDSWLGSEGHRANILRADYTDLGVGCAIAYLRLNPYSSGYLDYMRICAQNFGLIYNVTYTPIPFPTPIPTVAPTPTRTPTPTAIPVLTATPTPVPTPTPQP
ncbi:hypothetical protein A3D07_03760 [Candidatus Curtissbacteria bacterium RIFCSPHIGHO2_02_FULL_42_15]|uniref:SCP domain-containing protein n=1 Tax=Candidatus Curtissbacteria bacterium RIFCSPHIGHO2_02_FULL_42_15 TaxID=1797716 RepID=A0A1F5GJN1_9BACT|nr:MAG: hypothetical protein A3D07_03760 [Candidatus Curtissbacteria bacterium RIFCSPHIGHO2_02_FULL_42_15]